MKKIRVLIVDDSSTVRMILRSKLGADPDIAIAGAASNGIQALERLADDRPDVVLLDIEMPEMSGLETLVELRKRQPRLPVIMFSRFTQRGATETIDALFLGADDYVPKPESSQALSDCIHDELLPRIRLLGTRDSANGANGANGANVLNGTSESRGTTDDASKPAQAVARTAKATARLVNSAAPPEAQSASTTSSALKPARASTSRVDVVVIAASTGGPPVLATVLASLKRDLKIPVLIVQHMPPDFTKALADQLARKTGLLVKEAAPDQALSDAQVWVAPGDHHMFVRSGSGGRRVQINQAEPENSCRPAADVLFRSVAVEFGASVLGVVLTGMGKDGLAGCQSIVDCGGRVIVQDEASSAVWGMPGSVAKAGLADESLPPEGIGRAISLRLMTGR